MKHVKFKTAPLTNPSGQKGELNYRAYLEVAIKQPLDGKAMDVEETRRSIHLLDALEKSKKDGVDFEDADFELMVKKVRALRFSWADKAFVQFVDDVTNEVQ